MGHLRQFCLGLLLAFSLGVVWGCSDASNRNFSSQRGNFTTGDQMARLFGVHEIVMRGNIQYDNPFDVPCQVTFTPLSNSAKAVTVHAFYDGEGIWRARVYVNERGKWEWRSQALNAPDLDNRTGVFEATASSLRGILKRHPQNEAQWMTDDGRWFLGLGDTAYYLFKGSETQWQNYILEDWNLGVTLVRVNSLGGDKWNTSREVRALRWDKWWNKMDYYSPWDDNNVTRFNLGRHETTDSRLVWMLDNYPNLYIQLILFGEGSWKKDFARENWFKLPLPGRNNTLRYMLARWAAFPQLLWQITNDADFDENCPYNRSFAREVGSYIATHDAWNHLLSVGGYRGMRFPFTSPEDKWVSYVHLEDQFELGADVIDKYRDENMHVLLGEDRYEQDRRTLDPQHPKYYFRWLFWSWLLSGGSACYGGRWSVIQPYSETGSQHYAGVWGGEDDYQYSKPLEGLDSAKYIKQFLLERNIELWKFIPDDCSVSDLDGQTGRRRPKLMRRGIEEFLVYHPNAKIDGRGATVDKDKTARMRVFLKSGEQPFEVEWFRAEDGSSVKVQPVNGETYYDFTSPWKGCDVVLRLVKTPTPFAKSSLQGESGGN